MMVSHTEGLFFKLPGIQRIHPGVCEATYWFVGFTLFLVVLPAPHTSWGWSSLPGTRFYQGFNENSLGRNLLVCALVVDLEFDRVCLCVYTAFMLVDLKM